MIRRCSFHALKQELDEGYQRHATCPLSKQRAWMDSIIRNDQVARDPRTLDVTQKGHWEISVGPLSLAAGVGWGKYIVGTFPILEELPGCHCRVSGH